MKKEKLEKKSFKTFYYLATHPVSKENPKAKTAVSEELDENLKIMTAKEIMIDTQLWHNQRRKINPLQAQRMCNKKFISLSEVEKLRDELIRVSRIHALFHEDVEIIFDSILQNKEER